jgi:hypothetical protein
MDGNIKDTPPIIPLPREDERAKWLKVQEDLKALRAQAEDRKRSGRADYDSWLAAVKPEEMKRKIPTENLALLAELREGEGKTAQVMVDGKEAKLALEGAAWVAEKGKARKDLQVNQPGAVVFKDDLKEAGNLERDKPFTVGAWVQIPRGSNFGPIVARMEKGPSHRGWDLWYENGRFGLHLVSTWPTSGIKVLTRKTFNFNEWHHVQGFRREGFRRWRLSRYRSGQRHLVSRPRYHPHHGSPAGGPTRGKRTAQQGKAQGFAPLQGGAGS